MQNTEHKHFVEGYRQWLKTLGYSAQTVYDAPRTVHYFVTYQHRHGRRYGDWAPEHFRQFMEYSAGRPNQRREGGLSSAHLNKLASNLQRFQRYLVETEQGELYTELERYDVLRKPLDIFSVEQIQELYEACPSTLLGFRQRIVLGLCYGCGLRSGEARALNLDNIWWDKSLLQIKQSKTKTSRLVPIMPRVETELRHYVQAVRPHLIHDPSAVHLLVTARGGRPSGQVLYKHYQKLLERLDYPQSGLHKLRHSIASHLAAGGMPSAQIARFLGHRTLDSTQIYTHNQTLQDETSRDVF